VEYKVIEARDDVLKLQQAVNEQIIEGWEPLGGVALGYSPQSFGWWYYQAMVKSTRRQDLPDSSTMTTQY
jgi:Domain of unknown function (DUF1737)